MSNLIPLTREEECAEAQRLQKHLEAEGYRAQYGGGSWNKGHGFWITDAEGRGIIVPQNGNPHFLLADQCYRLLDNPHLFERVRYGTPEYEALKQSIEAKSLFD